MCDRISLSAETLYAILVHLRSTIQGWWKLRCTISDKKTSIAPFVESKMIRWETESFGLCISLRNRQPKRARCSSSRSACTATASERYVSDFHRSILDVRRTPPKTDTTDGPWHLQMQILPWNDVASRNWVLLQLYHDDTGINIHLGKEGISTGSRGFDGVQCYDASLRPWFEIQYYDWGGDG